MMPFRVSPVVKDGFGISSRHEGQEVFVKIEGNGDMETPLTLGGYMKEIHDECVRLRVTAVVVECEELYFMSSACVKCLVSWIDGILRLDVPERYKVTFRTNRNLPWQQRSFEALRRFAPSLVQIEA